MRGVNPLSHLEDIDIGSCDDPDESDGFQTSRHVDVTSVLLSPRGGSHSADGGYLRMPEIPEESAHVSDKGSNRSDVDDSGRRGYGGSSTHSDKVFSTHSEKRSSTHSDKFNSVWGDSSMEFHTPESTKKNKLVPALDLSTVLTNNNSSDHCGSLGPALLSLDPNQLECAGEGGDDDNADADRGAAVTGVGASAKGNTTPSVVALEKPQSPRVTVLSPRMKFSWSRGYKVHMDKLPSDNMSSSVDADGKNNNVGNASDGFENVVEDFDGKDVDLDAVVDTNQRDSFVVNDSPRSQMKPTPRRFSPRGNGSADLKPQLQVAPIDRAITRWNKGLHFLVVDDSMANRNIVKRLLLAHGHTVSIAEDGEEFIRIIVENRVEGDESWVGLGEGGIIDSSVIAAVKVAVGVGGRGSLDDVYFRVPYDAILMDDNMKRMNGPQAVRTVRAMGFRGLIIGLTGNSHKEDVDHFLAQGITCVLPKPLRVEALKDAVVRAMELADV